MSETPRVPPGVDPTKPSAARIYDYVLGGTYNFPVDREAAERIRAQSPDLADAAWVNRAFHQRAARWMAGQGIRQFIDIGSGLPTQSNTHGVVQEAIPDAHVVYVDNDPMVRAYASELLSGNGTTAVITADLREPDSILNDPALHALIDLDQPAGLLMTAVLHFVADDADPWALAARYAGALAPGSYLALSHITHEGLPPRAWSRKVCRSTSKPTASTRAHASRSSGSSRGWNSCRRTRAPSPPSPTSACGEPRPPSWPTATAPTGGTARLPAVPDQRSAVSRRLARPGRPADRRRGPAG